MNAPVGLLSAVAVVGIFVAALLSAAEAAILRCSRASLAEAREAHPRKADRLARFGEEPTTTAAAAAFVRILAEMVATACITVGISAVLDVWWHVLLLAIVVSTLVALLLVRFSPRTIGRNHPARVLVVLSGLLSVVLVLGGWSRKFMRRTEALTEETDEDLREMVELVRESDVIEEEDRELFRSVLEFGHTLTREVMVPRTDMVTISHGASVEDALVVLRRSGFSRIPVIGESEDDLRGIVYLKDALRLLGPDLDPERLERPVHKFMRDAHFVPESKPVDDLLRELQLASSHMAIAVDEYGGIAGLVTMEDALEELVGEVRDEHDRAVAEAEELENGVFRVPARMGLDELGELFGLEIEDDEVDTAAGLLAKALGKVPLMGSEADIHGIHLRAERVEGRRKRLSTLLVSRSELERDTNQDQAALEMSSQPMERKNDV